MSAATRRPGEPIDNLGIGVIVEVDGTHIIAELDAGIAELSRVYGGVIYPIGQFGSIIRIHFGRRIIYGYVSRLRMKSDYEREKGIITAGSPSARIVEADLFGEGEWRWTTAKTPAVWELDFERGISSFPLPQQKVYLTPMTELAFIFGQRGKTAIEIGEHVGSGGAPAFADLNELLGKHTAVLGSTGAGKSGTVAAILHCVLERGEQRGYTKWNPRIVLLDPHNEYGRAFDGHKRLSTDEGTLFLPYWLLNFQETIALLIGKTEFVATSQANIVKDALMVARQEAAAKPVLNLDPQLLTVDSPVPYSLERFKALVEAKKPTQPSKQDKHNSILEKLDILRRDSRFSFMMQEWDGASDPFNVVVGQFLGNGHPMRIVDLSGVPNEVAGAASSAIARTLFSVKLWQTPDEREQNPILLVCEEAHRYVPNVGEAQYEAAQEAIRRLAKEGRKYGIGLMLVSQRPSEVEATVLSQCNSWIVLRITNDTDREHVRAILPDSLSGLTKVLSGLRRREAIFVGQATSLPSRVLIRLLQDNQLPRSQDVDFDAGWQHEQVDDALLIEIGNRWRCQQRKTLK
ncbi:MAG: ATP-binding protein [Candidatus Lernaella stagnicola]|nr:ATP-binding protein [Candidatus Lernaella stagnicola]